MKKLLFIPMLFVVMISMASAQTTNDVWSPDELHNLNTLAFVEMIVRFLGEVSLSESSMGNPILDFDMARIKSYQASMRTMMDTIHTTPRADMPYSRDLMYQVTYESENMDFGLVGNEGIRYILRWWSNMMIQQSRSDSASASNGISDFDYGRFVLQANNLDVWIATYESTNAPTDLPQHSAYENQSRGN